MMYYVRASEDGRIESVTQSEEYTDGTFFQLDLPEGFDFSTQHEWRVVGGELVHDPLPPSEEAIAAREEAERRDQSIAAMPMMARMMAPSMSDAQLLSIPLLFEPWEAGRDYAAGEVLRHDGVLYRVAQAHTSQSQWVPGATGTESLYTRITVDPETGYDVWQQPTGAHDAYNVGDRVLYPDASGKVYESTIDGNVWSPDAYPQGWEEVTG